ncbi:hypothetical protein MTY66_63540 (plasmid) [Mycolicibacterium sp. TY66]|nr:hypothetical protein MTY66_63540 [Mycolicibacterium sp. TY66]BCJ84422.1 hypothetical protein MTY81_57950 [Mycolicibacterium sp. TY81]
MADKVWPFEGHFVVGGSGLYVTTGCLGQTVDSHTAGYDLTIGLPQVDRTPDPFPAEIRSQLNEPPRAPVKSHAADLDVWSPELDGAQGRRTHDEPCLGRRIGRREE